MLCKQLQLEQLQVLEPLVLQEPQALLARWLLQAQQLESLVLGKQVQLQLALDKQEQLQAQQVDDKQVEALGKQEQVDTQESYLLSYLPHIAKRLS